MTNRTRHILMTIGLIVLIGAIVYAFTRDTGEVTLPEGPQTMTGVLQPAAISLVRRGTHLLLREGEGAFYVESNSVDLRGFEGLDVVVTGTLEQNISKDDLPVLIASGVTLVQVASRAWEIPSLHVKLETPEQWAGHPFENGMRFTETGADAVLLAISSSTGTILPEGEALQVAGRRGISVKETDKRSVYLQNGPVIVTIAYTPAVLDDASDRLFTRVLRTFSFASQVSSRTPSVPSGTGSQSTGAPCGGAAGILCPAGQYCEVTDPVEGIGRCRTLAR